MGSLTRSLMGVLINWTIISSPEWVCVSRAGTPKPMPGKRSTTMGATMSSDTGSLRGLKLSLSGGLTVLSATGMRGAQKVGGSEPEKYQS